MFHFPENHTNINLYLYSFPVLRRHKLYFLVLVYLGHLSLWFKVTARRCNAAWDVCLFGTGLEKLSGEY